MKKQLKSVIVIRIPTQGFDEHVGRRNFEHLNTDENGSIDTEIIFKAVTGLQKRVRGSYAAVVLIHGVGILAFRDPYGIRPLVYGMKKVKEGTNYAVASESVAIDVLGYDICRSVSAGEAILFRADGKMFSRICAKKPTLSPCIFEYVYFARPDSIVDGVSVYEHVCRWESARETH